MSWNHFREAAKSSFLSGPATKAFSPPPSIRRLSDQRNFFPYIKKRKKVARPLRKELFLRPPLLNEKTHIIFLKFISKRLGLCISRFQEKVQISSTSLLRIFDPSLIIQGNACFFGHSLFTFLKSGFCIKWYRYDSAKCILNSPRNENSVYISRNLIISKSWRLYSRTDK